MTHIRTLLDQMAEIDEGRMKDIFTADQEGKSAKEIAKRLKLPLSTVKKILGEEVELQEFSRSQLDTLAKQYSDLKGKTISIDQANKLRKIFNRIPDHFLNDLRKKHIPFLSGLALSRMIRKGMPVREAFSVQVTKTDGGKFIHGTYKSKAEAEKWIKWYKTGDLRKTKKIEVVKEDVLEDDVNWAGKLEEDKDGKAYAIGMAKAKEVMKDEPPLEKKTITKAHDIAKAIKRDETIRIRPKNAIGEKKSPFRLSYSKQGTHAGFEDADTLSDLQNKAQKLRSKGFTIDKMGRNTSPVKEETIVEYTDKQIKQAYGILNDPRYKGGNYSGAVAAIEKLAKGLSKHKDVANALKRANESYVHPGKATFERIYREVSDKLKLKVLDRKIKRAKDKFHKGLRRP
tara:strand:+ start:2435 stop:3634 length:1200 start_codon:yes stop_codon:yes gene_type:complete